jgi:hypothetical protein
MQLSLPHGQNHELKEQKGVYEKNRATPLLSGSLEPLLILGRIHDSIDIIFMGFHAHAIKQTDQQLNKGEKAWLRTN